MLLTLVLLSRGLMHQPMCSLWFPLPLAGLQLLPVVRSCFLLRTVEFKDMKGPFGIVPASGHPFPPADKVSRSRAGTNHHALAV